MNIRNRILNELQTNGSAPVYTLHERGFGSTNTIRKALSDLRKAGAVFVSGRQVYAGNRKENVWAVSPVGTTA